MEKGRLCFWAAGSIFALFVADVLLAKVQVLAGNTIPIHLGDTLQFLVLLLAVTVFVAGTLVRERQTGEAKAENVTAGGNEPFARGG